MSDREQEHRNAAASTEHEQAMARGEKRVLPTTATGELHSYAGDEIGFAPGRGQAARGLSRPYYYGSNRISRTVHAYTEEEWGLGASSGGGDHNTIRSFWFSLVLTVVVALPATLFCAFLVVAALFRSPLMALIPLFFGLLFGLAVLQGYFNLAEEWQGRKARKRKGLPKPWFTVPDDHAYEWFLEHSSPDVPLTLEYFPESRLLRTRAEATDPPGGNEQD